MEDIFSAEAGRRAGRVLQVQIGGKGGQQAENLLTEYINFLFKVICNFTSSEREGGGIAFCLIW